MEHALFVELAIVRQVHLVALGNHLAAIQHHDGIVALALARQRQAEDDARSAVGGIGRKALCRPLAGRKKGGLQDEIFRRIARNEEFGEHDEIGPVPRGIGPRLAGSRQVAGNVADDGVDLGNRDAETVGRLGHCNRLARPYGAGNRCIAFDLWAPGATVCRSPMPFRKGIS